MKLATGLYEALITKDSAASLLAIEELVAESGQLTAETAPHVLAQHLYGLIEKAMRSAPGEDKLETQLKLASQLVGHLSEASWNTGVDSKLMVGVWLDISEELPTSMPETGRDGAAMPMASGESFVVLDVIQIEQQWCPLSKAGMYAYDHSECILNGEDLIFGAMSEGQWTVYDATLDGYVQHKNLLLCYGRDAQSRARPDQESVQLRLSKGSLMRQKTWTEVQVKRLHVRQECSGPSSSLQG